MRGSRYSDKTKAIALAVIDANDGNVSQAARELELPRSTLETWDSGEGVPDNVRQLRQQAKKNLADACEQIAWRALGRLNDGVLEKASAGTANAVAGTMIEKTQLLRGKPTSITESVARAESLREEAERIAREHNAPVDEVYARLQSRPELKAWLEGDQRAG